MAEKIFEIGEARLVRLDVDPRWPTFVVQRGEDRVTLTKRQLFDLALVALDELLEMDEGLPQCSGCGATIKWVTTEAGRPTPLDPKPKTFVLNEGKYQVGFTPHWATCPNADEFRRKR